MKRIINKILLLMLTTLIIFVSNVIATSELVQDIVLSTTNDKEFTYINSVVTTNGEGEIYYILDNDYNTIDNTFVSGLNEKTVKSWAGITNWNTYVTTPLAKGYTYSVCVYNTINTEDYSCASVKIPEPKPTLTAPKIVSTQVLITTEKIDNQAPFIKSVIIS